MNIFDKALNQMTGRGSRTPLSDDTAKLPSHYIEVNPKFNSERSTNQYGAVIVKFHWDLLAQTIASSYFIRGEVRKDIMTALQNTPVKDMKQYQTFKSALVYYFSDLNKTFDSSKSLDVQLNKFANESLLSSRTNISTTLGSGTAQLTFENLDNQWLFQASDNTYADLFGEVLFMEGLYLTIDAIGRFDSTKYYRIFTGSVKSYTVTDNPEDRTVSIDCRDLSKLLTSSRYNVHPALFNTDLAALQGKVTIAKNNLQNKSNVEIAKLVIPDVTKGEWSNPTDKFSVAAFKEMWKPPTSLPIKHISNAVGGTDLVTQTYRKIYNASEASYDNEVQQPGETELYYLVWGDKQSDSDKGVFSNTAHPAYALMFNKFELYLSEYQTRATVLKDTADLTLFFTYLDSSGNIHFHPSRHDYLISDKNTEGYPMYRLNNLDGSLENAYTYILDPGESISESYSSDEETIFTNLKVTGESAFGIFGQIQGVNPRMYRPMVAWWDGMKRFGFKEQTISTAAFQGSDAEAKLKAFGLAVFMRSFFMRRTMTCSIPLRPELDIDRPFYVPGRKKVYHIKGIQHSYTAGTDRSGGEFITTVNCDSGRPLHQADLISTNLFKNLDSDQLINIFYENGFNLDVDIGGTGK
jgi:hypothetical protein